MQLWCIWTGILKLLPYIFWEVLQELQILLREIPTAVKFLTGDRKQGGVLCLITQSSPTLWDPMDCSLQGSSVHGDSPGKNIGVSCHAFSRVSSQPRDWTQVPCTAGRFFARYTSLNLYSLSLKWTSEIFRGLSNLPAIQLRAWKERKFKSSKFKSTEKEYFALKFYCSHKKSGKYWQLFILK